MVSGSGCGGVFPPLLSRGGERGERECVCVGLYLKVKNVARFLGYKLH